MPPIAVMQPTPEATSTTPRRKPRTRSRPWVPYAGGLLLLAALGGGLWPRPTPVETAPVTVGTLRSVLTEEGRTRIRHRYRVSAPVSGQLRRPPFQAGAEVRGGETIVAVIDPLSPIPLDARSRALAEARRDAAAAQLEKARATLGFALSELRRYEQLHRDGTVSIQELERIQWQEAAARRDQTAAESALRQAEAELFEFLEHAETPGLESQAPVEVRAPVSGRILRVHEENARVVAAGQVLLEIGDPTDLEVVVEVLSRDGAVLTPGTPVELTQWGGAGPLEARVRLVEPAAFTKVSALGVEEQRVNVVADLVAPPDRRPGLGDQFRVEAHFIVWEAAHVLKIPSGALFRQGTNWAAFVFDKGRAALRPVTIGRAGHAETQALEGLREGEEVLLYPGDRVRDRQRVRKIQI